MRNHQQKQHIQRLILSQYISVLVITQTLQDALLLLSLPGVILSTVAQSSPQFTAKVKFESKTSLLSPLQCTPKLAY